MPATHQFRFCNLVLFTMLPALLVGGLLSVAAGYLLSCSTHELARLTAPDQAFDLVIFSRSCGVDSGPNTQMTLILPDDSIPEDAASFLSIGAYTDLAPRWADANTVELTL
ncbi:MAG: hypothetical protein MO846_11400 [Candidatus Devosia symbiotica]|nr:hypothetical protein [Candidatus Devosia symbiotica]